MTERNHCSPAFKLEIAKLMVEGNHIIKQACEVSGAGVPTAIDPFLHQVSRTSSMEHAVRNNRTPLRLIIGLMALLSMTACSTLGIFQSRASKPQYVYVVNVNSGNISAFRINPNTGALTPVAGSPFAAGDVPDSITVNPAGTFAYVTNGGTVGNGTVSAYRINPATGALTPVAGNPFAAGRYPDAVSVNPAGTSPM